MHCLDLSRIPAGHAAPQAGGSAALLSALTRTAAVGGKAALPAAAAVSLLEGAPDAGGDDSAPDGTQCATTLLGVVAHAGASQEAVSAACEALAALLKSDRDAKALVVAASGAAALLTALQERAPAPTTGVAPTLCFAAASAVHCMAGDEAGATALAAAGAVACIAALLQAQLDVQLKAYAEAPAGQQRSPASAAAGRSLLVGTIYRIASHTTEPGAGARRAAGVAFVQAAFVRAPPLPHRRGLVLWCCTARASCSAAPW